MGWQQVNQWSATEYYRQVADQVRVAIESGELRAYDPLPSEKTLAEACGVGKDTVRRALAELRDDGLVFTLGTRGTFVAERGAGEHSE